MIALWIAAALQSDWGELRRERELSAEEVEDLRDRLDAWGAARGVKAFRGFGRAVSIDRARQVPVYQVRATTLDEGRELGVERKPYDKSGTLVREAEEVDLEAPPLPAFSGFEGRQWRLPVAGSARTLSCPACAARGRVACSRCHSRRTLDCERCRGAGKAACSPCGGTSKIRCSSCWGRGSSGSGSKRRGCSWCSGSGKRSCGSCSTGKVRCDPCRGNGRADCGVCSGRGDLECGGCRGRKTLVETREIVISLRPRVREAAVTLLPERWAALVDANEPWIQAEGEEADRRSSLIADPFLAAAARRALEESREAVSGRARGTQLRVRKSPAVLARLRWDALNFECDLARIGPAVHFDLSPAAVWASREAERAEDTVPPTLAKAIAAEALRADPDCRRARRLLDRIEEDERAEAERVEHASLKNALLTGLFALAGAVALTMLLLKIYMVRRRRPAA